MINNLKIQSNVPLYPLSTFSIGGKCEFFTRVDSSEKLIDAIDWSYQNNKEYHVVASGSNVVFPDGILRGLLIQILGGQLEVGRNKMVAASGVLLSEVIKGTIIEGFSGLEYLSGIPGTIGGAVVGNAGAYGHSISEVVDSVAVWDNGNIKSFTKTRCEFDYRESIFKRKQYILLSIILKFQKGNSKKLFEQSQKIINLRKTKYKPGLKCPGSFFKNVLVSDLSSTSLKFIDQAKIIDSKVPAGYLLDSIGARGMRVGAIQIADFHGNLFINTGGGTARQVRQLAQILKDKVYKKFAIRLEEEIRYL